MEEKILSRSEDSDGKTTVSLELCEDGGVRIFYHDIGPAAKRMFGDIDYEAWLRVPPGQLGKLAFVLLSEKFEGRADALSRLRALCEANGVGFENDVWS